jgi:hypothetical protein
LGREAVILIKVYALRFTLVTTAGIPASLGFEAGPWPDPASLTTSRNTAGHETIRRVDKRSAIRSVGASDRDPGMTIESILRIAITAMMLFLVIAAASAQTPSTPLYVDGVLRVVAPLPRINEGSLPVSGSMHSFGTNVYPSWTRDPERTRRFFKASTQRFRGWSGQMCT